MSPRPGPDDALPVCPDDSEPQPPLLSSGSRAALEAVLAEARALGFLGPGGVEAQVDHALGFAEVLGAPPRRTAGARSSGRVGTPLVLDLGAGGGLPGLVIALACPGWSVSLLDSNERRTRFLARAVGILHLQARAEVRRARAEDAGHDQGLRGGFAAVVARSFGPPGVTAECAAPFLRVGGRLIVSEPPEGEVQQRWPATGLARLGLSPAVPVSAQGVGFVVLHQETSCPEAYPRRVGVPTKRPLF